MLRATPPSPSQEAVWFAGKGYRVLPLHSVDRDGCTCGRAGCDSPGKHPYSRPGYAPRGLKDATNDVDIVAGWFKRRLHLNYGVRTGALLVVDIDARSGGIEAWQKIARKSTQPQIHTWMVSTGGGGQHLFFRNPDKIGCGNLERGIDLKGVGGYVVGPGSLHASGRRYRWAPQCSPADVRRAAIPDWLNDLIKQRLHVGAVVSIDEWRRRVREPAEDGERHSRFLQVAGYLIARMIDPLVVRELMLSWNTQNCFPPLDERDVCQMLENLAERELAKIGRLRS